MHAPLVDKEGFPRSDIDVAGVRTARVHIIRLRNDLGDLQREMEQVVVRGLPRDDGEPAVAAEAEDAQMQDQGAEGETPFAKVDAVAPGSPADTAVRPLLASFLASASLADFRHKPLALDRA